MNRTEEFRAIPGTGDRYEVSNYGRVRSYYTTSRSKNKTLLKNARLLKPSIDRLGYVDYRLQIDGIQKHYKAHRLVAAAFLGESDMDVNHRDGDKRNNFVGNLEYCTESENMRHARDVLGKRPGWPQGTRRGEYKFTTTQINEALALMAQGVPQRDIAKRLGMSRSVVYQIKKGQYGLQCIHEGKHR